MNFGRVFYTQFSDYFITAVVFCTGVVFFAHGFSEPRPFSQLLKGFFATPAYFIFYLWAKAIFVDVVRIHRKEKVKMPGYVFIAYGFQFMVFWMIKDLMYDPFSTRPLEEYFYYQNPLLFWLIFEIFTSFILLPLKLSKRDDKNTESFLSIDMFRALTLFLVFVLVNAFLSFF